MLKASTPEAYRLLHDGAIAMAEIEANGFRIDTEYLTKMSMELKSRINALEEKLRSDVVYEHWRKRFGGKTNLASRLQLAEILFKVLKYPCKEYTEKSKTLERKEDWRPKADKDAIRSIDLPFLRDYVLVEEYRKARNTFLKGLIDETVDGYLHPFFHLHTVISFRSSSSDPNFQNLPSRNKEIATMIRRCFIPREGRQLLEMDFSGIEVRVAAIYTKDPVLIDYIRDPTTDMHRDTASQLFLLPIEYLKQESGWAKMTVRDWAKNRFVFPEFYGSVYFQCAPHLWDAIVSKSPDGKMKRKLPNGISIHDHLKSKGIKSLGETDPEIIKRQGGPKKGTFVYHVKKIEDDFWQNRFRVYTEWKRRWWESYQRKGRFQLLSGFTIEGVYKRNEVLNLPIQGFAFHCLLWTLIQLQRWLRKYKMKTLIVGQIHDSMILDAVPGERDAVIEKVRELVSVGLRKHWPCIIVPMEIETELCEVGAPWCDKRKV